MNKQLAVDKIYKYFFTTLSVANIKQRTLYVDEQNIYGTLRSVVSWVLTG